MMAYNKPNYSNSSFYKDTKDIANQSYDAALNKDKSQFYTYAGQIGGSLGTIVGSFMGQGALGAAIGSSAFCCLFGGGAMDCVATLIAGFLVQIFILKVRVPYLSKITGNVCGGALVTLVCILCYQAGIGENLNHMIVGSVIPLIPGVAFINGIREIADEDYISGSVRLLDAVLGFLCIAIGVGVMLGFVQRITGGILS